MDERRWRVGELADQAGLTVRALPPASTATPVTPEAATRGALSTGAWTYLKRAFAVGFTVPPA